MPYPPQTSRQAILKAALELLETGGPTSLSMRALAKQLGVNASSLYHHISDKEALEGALADEGAARLLGRLEGVTEGRGAGDALEAMARIYLAFAGEHRALYNLMMTPRPQAEAGAGKNLWNFVLARVGAVTGRDDDTAAAVAFWSFLHGFASLEHSGGFGPSGARGGLEVGLNALLIGLPTVPR